MKLILSDFDGTITNRDFLAILFDTYCPEKRVLTERMCARGLITSSEQINMCLRYVNVNINIPQLVKKFGITVDPFFKDFYFSLKANGVPFYIISSGLKVVIKHLLPFVDDSEILASVIDKVEILNTLKKRHPRHRVVYYGDGISDFKVSRHVDELYVKNNSALHVYARDNNLNYIAFDNFLQRDQPIIVHIGCGRLFMGFVEQYFSNSQRIFLIKTITDNPRFGTVKNKGICFLGTLQQLINVIGTNLDILFTISVGVCAFDEVYNQIIPFKNAAILTFENHLLYDNKYNVHVCYADKICKSLEKIHCDDVITITVHTEEHPGTLLLPESCKRDLTTFLDTTEHLQFVDNGTIQTYALRKKLSINCIQLVLSLFARRDPFCYNDCLNKSSLRILAVYCIRLKKRLCIPMREAFVIFSQTIKRIRYSRDQIERIQRNLTKKMELLII
jgi:2-hydroxy-3-keto-5-methylthiopentenyl-1-phosphate phosphatase